ncbi:MAG: SHOCT domain-containing protein [Mycobacterium sp.]
MMYWYGHDMGWWGYASVAILMAVFWVLVIAAIAAMAKYLVADRPQQRDAFFASASPDDVLAARFARGEINEAEYRDRVAVLREAKRV